MYLSSFPLINMVEIKKKSLHLCSFLRDKTPAVVSSLGISFSSADMLWLQLREAADLQH